MSIHKYYQKIKDKTEEKYNVIGKLDLTKTIIYSSYVKCLEFNLVTSKNNEENLIFHLPILRSLCEEIIFVNYLLNVIEEGDRKDFITLYQFADCEKSVIAQENYFSENRNFQPILTKKMMEQVVLDKIDIPTIHQRLKTKYKWKRKFPTIKQIADDGSMINLYNYLYAATSRLVHFNPQRLFQMVWGELKSTNEGLESSMKISINHYKKYYNEFCIFYGYKLFELFTSKFKSNLEIDIEDELDDIVDYFKNKRWPEIITFEEMNIKLEDGRKFFHLEKNGIGGYWLESMRIEAEKEQNNTQNKNQI